MIFNPAVLVTYFRIFQKYVGKRLILVFVLSVFAVLVESLGITLVLPLIGTLGVEGHVAASSGHNQLSGWVSDLVSILGLQNSTGGILILIGVLVGAKGLIRFCADAYGSILTAQLEREIKGKLFNAYSQMNFSYYTAHDTGHFINIINGQVPRLIQTFSAYKTFLVSLLTTTGYLTVALLVNWRFALMAMVFGGTVLITFRRLNVYVGKLSRQTAVENGKLSGFLVQCLQSYKYVASTGTIAPLKQKIHRSIHRLTGYARNQGLASSFTGAVREPVSIIAILIVLMVQIHFFQSSMATIMVSLILLYRAMGQIMLLQSTWQNMMNQVGSLEIVENEFKCLDSELEKNGTRELPPFSKEIRLEAVGYRYHAELPDVLRDITLTIPARSTVAFVGPSGAGKSTLVDLLTLLLKPTSGQVSIDTIAANDIDLHSWRNQIGYVSQDTVVFNDTIANNIGLWTGTYGEDSAFTADVVAAAEAANALKFIEALPEGFNTIVGDRGVRISGGQKQRLFIARELFKKPGLLILDEATSALDSESERAIQSSIDQLKGRTTIIIIAHRLSTIRNADVVCVLEGGRFVEKGTYDELINLKHSRFGEMVSAQTL
ncbi:MAG TPA: ABC transporter ATP-binding protein [Opitutae bacterium]|nr:ABC transporter ATP-binding protein [Opitutae bacterium]